MYGRRWENSATDRNCVLNKVVGLFIGEYRDKERNERVEILFNMFSKRCVEVRLDLVK